MAPMSILLSAGAVDDEITWTYERDILTISGNGELSSEYTTTQEWLALKDKCLYVKIGEGITAIGDRAFENFSRIEKVEISDNVTRIGAYAFSGCKWLNVFNLPSSVTTIGEYAFAGCSSIGVMNISSSIVEIGDWAFKDCTCFYNVNLFLPDTIEKIGQGAFSGAGLKSITLPYIGSGSSWLLTIFELIRKFFAMLFGALG